MNSDPANAAQAALAVPENIDKEIMRAAFRKSPLLQLSLAGRWLPIALVLTGCATQPVSESPTRPLEKSVQATESTEISTLRSLTNLQDQLYRVTAPILVNNTELCKGNARNLLGFSAKNKYSYSVELAAAAESLLGLDERLQIMAVLSGGGADKAGVRRGDKLLAVEDASIPTGLNAERQAASILLPLMKNRSTVKLTVLRKEAEIPMTVPLTYACAFGVELGNADHANAYNDGRRVLITRGMMNFAQSDTELAYILAKEMAHNSLRHASKQQAVGTVSAIIENLVRIQPDLSSMAGSAGVKTMPQNLDIEADKLALYMLARAGYSIDGAARFWQRLATRYPASVLNSYTAIHPVTAQRLSAIEKNVAEIKSKQASRRPLLP
jgi:beta-barrel assembly-enhancing protease